MPLRRLLNLSYASLTDGMTGDSLTAMNVSLAEKFDHEMTPEESKRAEAFRRTVAAGGLGAQRDITAMMGMHR